MASVDGWQITLIALAAAMPAATLAVLIHPQVSALTELGERPHQIWAAH